MILCGRGDMALERDGETAIATQILGQVWTRYAIAHQQVRGA